MYGKPFERLNKGKREENRERKKYRKMTQELLTKH